jgi:hypothetical protein
MTAAREVVTSKYEQAQTSVAGFYSGNSIRIFDFGIGQ